MATDIPTIYRSTAPEVLAKWEDTQARWRAVHEAIGALEKEFPEHKALVRTSNSRYYFCGLRGAEPPGPEWRYDRNQEMWVADKRTKAGKALAARLAELKAERLGVLPGMPEMQISNEDSMAYHAGIKVIDGVAWARWNCPSELVETGGWGKFDGALWERAKPSDYFTAVENEQEVA